ncbi:MAG: ribosomal protein S18-alanine N-acetyltransferase [Clostridia bacterium]|nr:ribosomal protein S18-alanine N-acetyltransferase [Clostridia bacterium]
MKITVVPMTDEHIPALARLEALCFADPWSESALHEELDNPCSHFLTALVDNKVVGYLGCHHIADEGFIANIAVSPAMRRQGVARALVSSAIENGSSLSRLTLEVRQSNAAAIALYQSFGFVGEGARPRFYSHPTEDALIYSYYYPKSE